MQEEKRRERGRGEGFGFLQSDLPRRCNVFFVQRLYRVRGIFTLFRIFLFLGFLVERWTKYSRYTVF